MRLAVRRTGKAEPGEPGGGARIVAFDRLRGVDPAAQRIILLVASERQVSARLLLHRTRCGAAVAEARQLAMYLVHVLLSRTYAEVGALFGRDRTTVSHACAHIEDLREAPEFDAEVARLEAALTAREPEEVRHACG
jgi:chromosomal replication initiation ATPase DnaA